MQFPESWLRALCNPEISTDELAHRLTMAGLEVEDVDPVAPEFSGVRVAHVLSVEPHPNADKLRVCQVEAGFDQPVQIVCGAPNVAPGVKVPLAKVGAKLPGGIEIGVAKMRGVESAGMLCSARELGLSDENSGLLILDDSLETGSCLRRALDLNDKVFTLKLTPNKADCLSVLGVAREISALTGAALDMPKLAAVPVSLDEVLPVKVQAPDLCGRFSGRVIRGVNAKALTPSWMKQRLERAGQRPISALVDISNYVMLELGRPSHVFDLDKIQGGLTVRWGKAGESLLLLNGQTVELDAQVGVIEDERGIESLAGIMGGDATAVSLETQNIYLEAAFWWPESIAGRARRFNFSTDAGYRFERGVDFATTVEHIDYITSLIVSICGGQVGPVDDQIVNIPKREPVTLRVARCHRILGVTVSEADIAQIFTRLNLTFEQRDGVFVVTPPSYRFDLEIEEDLIEEVARIYGFERIPDLPPVVPAVMRAQPESVRSAQLLRRAMVGLDYQELINFSFVEESWEKNYAGNDNAIRLLNPIASQLAVMRSSLLGGLIANAHYNLNRKASRIRVFEYGRVFWRDSQAQDGALSVAGVQQPLKLAGLAYGPAQPEQWGIVTRQVDFFDVKADVETLLAAHHDIKFEAASYPALHPGRSAKIIVNGKAVGYIGELHPKWVQENDFPHPPVVFEIEAEVLVDQPLPKVKELSKQPVVTRDLAMWVADSVTVNDMLSTVQSCIIENDVCQIVQSVRLFDVWKDKNSHVAERSLAFRFVLQDASVTLEDARVDEVMTLIRDKWMQAHGARTR